MPSEPQQIGGWDGVERRRAPNDHEVMQRVEELLEQRLQSPGLKIRNFGDLQAALSIAVVLIGGIAWGLKLEARIDELLRNHVNMQAQISKGILPLTEERILSLTTRLDRREQEGERAMLMIRDVQKECQQAIRSK
jgi:ACT domain-containing protein